MLPVLIDCDTGIDDAMALVLACASRKVDILGVTTVAGNVDCLHTTQNTLNVLHMLGRDDIPVAEGAHQPLTRPLMKASGVHGLSGLRGYTFPNDWRGSLVHETALLFQRRVLLGAERKVTLIAIGPLTNIALLLASCPEVKQSIERIVFMGTSYHTGNPTPLATFNVLVDPEAFRIVAFSGVPFFACPLDLTRQVVITEDMRDSITRLQGPIPAFVAGIMQGYGLAGMVATGEKIDTSHEEVISKARIENSKKDGINVHDPVTVAAVIAPELFTEHKYYCDVECKGELTTGFTLIDKDDYYRKPDGERNLHLYETIDKEGFSSLFMSAIASYGIMKEGKS